MAKLWDRASASLRRPVKRLLRRTGAAAAFHRLRNRGNLTVVMFHRVLPPEDPRYVGADPAYTITPRELEGYLSVFRRYYNVVGLHQLEEAAEEGAQLPPRPLLITFDDGWRDNFDYALPVLRDYGVSAVLFVATEHIGRGEGFWQEELQAAYRMERLTRDDLMQLGLTAAEADGSPDTVLGRLIGKLESYPADERARLLEAHLPDLSDLPRRMLNEVELARLQGGGVAIGGHGHSHEPLTHLQDPRAETAVCYRAVAPFAENARPSFSFPHGRYDDQALAAVREAGFGLVFTSDAELVPTTRLTIGCPIGRILISAKSWQRHGRWSEAELLFSLITRPVAAAPVDRSP